MSEYNASTKINWLNTIFLVSTPILAVVGVVLHWFSFGAPGWT